MRLNLGRPADGWPRTIIRSAQMLVYLPEFFKKCWAFDGLVNFRSSRDIRNRIPRNFDLLQRYLFWILPIVIGIEGAFVVRQTWHGLSRRPAAKFARQFDAPTSEQRNSLHPFTQPHRGGTVSRKVDL